MKLKRHYKVVISIVLAVVLLISFIFISQTTIAHRDDYFKPDYDRVALTVDTDYETIFLQTGLGKQAVDKLKKQGQFDIVSHIKDKFFNPPESDCVNLLGWLTREDRLESPGAPFVDLQPGDIIVTLSTHSYGWRHGHAGLVLDSDSVLASEVLGMDSTIENIESWTTYSNYAVLRVKGVTAEQQKEIVKYAKENLMGVPYNLFAGFIGSKAPKTDEWYFGLQCSYLAWYAWQQFGVDLDSDGGRLVSTSDLIGSDKVEIVQIFGMNPKNFLER